MKPQFAAPNTLAAQTPVRGPVSLVQLVRDKFGGARYVKVGSAAPQVPLVRQG